MRYWVYMNGEVPGSYEPDDLASIPGFDETTMLCAAGGAVAQRNWKRAGEFPEVRDALARARESAAAAAAPAPKGPEPALKAEDFLDGASSRIFGHVTELMRELEGRREERALAESLTLQLAEFRAELKSCREREARLESQASAIPVLEERVRTLEAELASLRESSARLRRERDALAADLEGRSAAVRDVTARLGEKEAALARALAVVGSLEKALREMLPAPPAAAPAPVPEPAARPEPAPQAYTLDSGRPEAPVELPPEGELKPMPSPLGKALSKVFGWPKP